MDQSIILSLSFLCGVSRSPDAAGTLVPVLVCLDSSAVVCAPLAMAMGEVALIPQQKVLSKVLLLHVRASTTSSYM